MFGSENKVILVTSEVEYYDEYDCNTQVKTEMLESGTEVAGRFAGLLAGDYMAMEELLKNEAFVKALDDRGFRDVKKMTDINDKVKFGKRFYTHEGSYTLTEIDLEKASRWDGERLAKDGTILLQSVEKSCLRTISPKAYKSMQGAKKRIKAATAGRKAKAAERAKKKKEKELDKARKLLKEAGE